MANKHSVTFSPETLIYAREHSILAKFNKAKKYLGSDIRHKSLNTELLEPKQDGIYSFRIDKKYRGLFFFNKRGEIEIFALTNHYR